MRDTLVAPWHQPATVAVLAASAATWLSVAFRPTAPLYGLLVPAALLPLAYVVDTAHRSASAPGLEGLRHREAAMLSAALLAVLFGTVGLATGDLATRVLSALAATGSVALVAANWRHRRSARR